LLQSHQESHISTSASALSEKGKKGEYCRKKEEGKEKKKRKVRRWDIIRKRSKGSGRRSVREKGSGEIEVGKLKDRRK